jgi:hypothetical protein
MATRNSIAVPVPDWLSHTSAAVELFGLSLDPRIAPVDSPAADAIVTRIVATQFEREVLVGVGRLQAPARSVGTTLRTFSVNCRVADSPAISLTRTLKS